MTEWWQWVLVVIGFLLMANFGPGPLAFMRTTRNGNRRVREWEAAIDAIGRSEAPR